MKREHYERHEFLYRYEHHTLESIVYAALLMKASHHYARLFVRNLKIDFSQKNAQSQSLELPSGLILSQSN